MGDREGTERSRPCPPWCRRSHEEQRHPEDRHHQSEARHASVVTGHPTLEPDDLATAATVVGRLVRRTDSAQTWVELVSEEGRLIRLVVTLGSAQRLHALLGELLGRAQPS